MMYDKRVYYYFYSGQGLTLKSDIFCLCRRLRDIVFGPSVCPSGVINTCVFLLEEF